MKEVVIVIQEHRDRGNAVGHHLTQEGYKFFTVPNKEAVKTIVSELIGAGIDPFATITCVAAENPALHHDKYELRTWGTDKELNDEPVYQTVIASDVVRKLTELHS